MKTHKEMGRENEPIIYPTYYDLWLLSCKGKRILNHGQIKLRNTKKINLLYRQNLGIKRRNEIHHKPILFMSNTICCLCCCRSQRYPMLHIWTQNARKPRENNVEKGSGTQKNLSFDRESKKTNMCSWSLEIRIKTFWDKNDSFRRNNEHAVKKPWKKRIQMQIEVKKRKRRRRRGGKRKHIKTTSIGIEAKIKVFWDKTRKRTSIHGVWR